MNAGAAERDLQFLFNVPESWTTDAPRRVAVGIPETLRFREKWRIALAQVRTVVKAGFTLTGVSASDRRTTNGNTICSTSPRPPR